MFKTLSSRFESIALGSEGTNDIMSLSALANSPTAAMAAETVFIPLSAVLLLPTFAAILRIGVITSGRFFAICAEIPAMTSITTGRAFLVALSPPPLGIAIAIVSIIADAKLLTA